MKAQPSGSYSHCGKVIRVKLTIFHTTKKKTLKLQLAFTFDEAQVIDDDGVAHNLAQIWWKFPNMRTYRKLGKQFPTVAISEPLVKSIFVFWVKGGKEVLLPQPFNYRRRIILYKLRDEVLKVV